MLLVVKMAEGLGTTVNVGKVRVYTFHEGDPGGWTHLWNKGKG